MRWPGNLNEIRRSAFVRSASVCNTKILCGRKFEQFFGPPPMATLVLFYQWWRMLTMSGVRKRLFRKSKPTSKVLDYVMVELTLAQ
jgi:hypothetical protein